MLSYHLVIKGRVQGVYYRASAKAVADELGVNGWIRNTQEGNVEAYVQGDEPSLRSFIAWCETGPPGAIVHEVTIRPAEQSSAAGFHIVRG